MTHSREGGLMIILLVPIGQGFRNVRQEQVNVRFVVFEAPTASAGVSQHVQYARQNHRTLMDFYCLNLRLT